MSGGIEQEIAGLRAEIKALHAEVRAAKNLGTLKIRDVARLLGCSRRGVWRRVTEGVLAPGRAFGHGHARLWTIEEVMAAKDALRVEDRASVVYFIRSPMTGLIKIGTTRRLQTRLGDLCRAAGHDVELLASMPGSVEEEYALHQRFAKHRERGEWFRASEELAALIGSICGDGRPIAKR